MHIFINEQEKVEIFQSTKSEHNEAITVTKGISDGLVIGRDYSMFNIA